MGDTEKPDRSEDSVNFIRDEPSEEDFFQTHGRLATAIAAAIRSNSNLRVIGLLGRWGSGKSTVIRHLKSRLREISANESKASVHVFTYDAWLHQSDPVRRSFLESLLSFLIDAELTSKETWTEKLQELTGHVEKTDVTQTPILTEDAKWILASLVPVPVAMGLLDLNTIKDAWGKTTSVAGIASFWLALCLLALPIIVTFVRYRINKSKAETGELTSVLPLLMNRSVERTRSITHRTPDPTSIEFGTIFREIMADATKQGDRFVFVIDNLDRIAEKEALQMWATVRSFFLKADEIESFSPEYTAPIVILPVDTHALERMFALSEDEKAARALVRSFVNKTFDITFEVSEPVMSDWRAYIERQMQRVFGPVLQNTWVFWTRHFFEEYLPISEVKVTPREINKLVNRIAALYLQWKEEQIQFEVLAYFAVRGRGASSNILQFINDARNDIESVAPDWKLQFAALHYGVARNKAAQVLIEEPLRAAVAKRDETRFKELSSVPGFGDTFERLTSSSALNQSGGDPSFDLVTNAALLASTIHADDQVWLQQSWRNLINRYFDTDGFGANANQIEERVAVFFPQLSGKQEMQKFVDGTAQAVGATLSSDEDEVTANLTRRPGPPSSGWPLKLSANRHFQPQFQLR